MQIKYTKIIQVCQIQSMDYSNAFATVEWDEL